MAIKKIIPLDEKNILGSRLATSMFTSHLQGRTAITIHNMFKNSCTINLSKYFQY